MPDSDEKRKQKTPRMGKYAGGILASPRDAKAMAKAHAQEAQTPARERPWYLCSTPDELQVPDDRLEADKWIKKHLNLDTERKVLEAMTPHKELSASWPDDGVDIRSPGGKAVMGSHKLLMAKEHTMLQNNSDAMRFEAWKQTQPKVEKPKDYSHSNAYRAAGFTEFEISMDEYEKADKSLGVMRKAAVHRPYHFHSEHLLPTFDRLRDRYNSNRGHDQVGRMTKIGVDFSSRSYADGGPPENRNIASTTKPETPKEEDFDTQLILSPTSPMGFITQRTKRPPRFLGDDGPEQPRELFPRPTIVHTPLEEETEEANEGENPVSECPTPQNDEDFKIPVMAPIAFGGRFGNFRVRIAPGNIGVSDEDLVPDPKHAPVREALGTLERKQMKIQEERQFLCSDANFDPSTINDPLQGLVIGKEGGTESEGGVQMRSQFMLKACKFAPGLDQMKFGRRGVREKPILS